MNAKDMVAACKKAVRVHLRRAYLDPEQYMSDFEFLPSPPPIGDGSVTISYKPPQYEPCYVTFYAGAGEIAARLKGDDAIGRRILQMVGKEICYTTALRQPDAPLREQVMLANAFFDEGVCHVMLIAREVVGEISITKVSIPEVGDVTVQKTALPIQQAFPAWPSKVERHPALNDYPGGTKVFLFRNDPDF